MEWTAINLEEIKVEAKNSNFNIFYKYKNEKSYLVHFIYKYQLINIQYIYNIKKNKFKLKNIIKLSTSIRHIKKAAKSLKININSLEIEIKEKDYTTADTKSIILLFWAFYVYIQILIFLAVLKNKL